MSGLEDDTALESRPVSRRGVKNDHRSASRSPPGTAADSHSISHNSHMQPRPGTASRTLMRPPSAQAFPRGQSRLGKASVLGMSNINVLDRPITQQGVTGLRTATARSAQQRQVLDKRYFEGLIRVKMRDITAEVARLNGEMDNQRQLQATSRVYEARVREVAAELTGLQGQLADLNVVVDKLNTSAEAAHIEAEAAELRGENDAHAMEQEQVFAQNRAKEDQLHHLETDIMNERNMTEKLISDMGEEDRARYQELSELSRSLQGEIETHQHHLDGLNSRKAELEDKVSGSQMKQEAVRLHHKVREREERREALIEEGKSRTTPAQEREQLLHKVKEDNAEMAAMERQLAQMTEQVKKKREELDLVEQDLEETQSDRHHKFKELKKREETMEQFLGSFEENRDTETKRIAELEGNIVVALQTMSKNLVGGALPTQDEFSIMKENLTLKQDELEKSKMTMDELAKKQQQMVDNLKKVGDLEVRIQTELASLRDQMATMAKDSVVLVDLDALRNEAQSKRERLMGERERLTSQKPDLSERFAHLQATNQDLVAKLNDNETYVQLNNLEKKLQVLEASNAGIREFIAARKQEFDYGPAREEALALLNTFNDMLKASYSKKG